MKTIGELLKTTEMPISVSISNNNLTQCQQLLISADNFLRTYNPSEQFKLCANEVDCYFAKTPNINAIAEAFGKNVVVTWIAIQLHDLSEFSGAKEKLSIEQIDQTAKIISQFFGNLKPEELMLFFLQFKAGVYGKFYGAIDGMTITEKLREFVEEKNYKIQQLSEEQSRSERKQHSEEIEKNAMTYDEWLASRGLPKDYQIFNYGIQRSSKGNTRIKK